MIIKGRKRFRFTLRSAVTICAKALLSLAFLAYMWVFLAVLHVCLN